MNFEICAAIDCIDDNAIKAVDFNTPEQRKESKTLKTVTLVYTFMVSNLLYFYSLFSMFFHACN